MVLAGFVGGGIAARSGEASFGRCMRTRHACELSQRSPGRRLCQYSTRRVSGVGQKVSTHGALARGRTQLCMKESSGTEEKTKSSAAENGVPDAGASSHGDVPAALQEARDQSRISDLVRTIGVGLFVSIVAALVQHDWISDHESVALWAVFVVGYAGIILEEILDFNKTGVALLMSVGVWAILGTAAGGQTAEGHALVLANLNHALSEVSEIIYFLVGAMTIVEIVDAHNGFKLVTDLIRTNSRQALLWVIGLITFFMSSMLDNLTSTIVMVSLLRKLIKDPEERKLFGSVVVIAANAGGAWTPIGDVTTTMLWMNGNISTLTTMRDLLLPSLACMGGALAYLTPSMSGKVEKPTREPSGFTDDESETPLDLDTRGKLVFAVGLSALISVPIFKTVTGLPPFLGMISGLGTLWLITDVIHAGDESKQNLRASAALARIDVAGTLFFLGILLTVAGLQSAGLLQELAVYLDSHVPSRELIAMAIGLLSAVVDNVPLVAATMGMYNLNDFPVDSALWQLIAYSAGVGGSILVIGSAAGVALMGMEKVDFMWYVKKISVPAAIGFFAGFGVYALQSAFIAPRSQHRKLRASAKAPLSISNCAHLRVRYCLVAVALSTRSTSARLFGLSQNQSSADMRNIRST
ncbi:Sodium/proton antiporter 1 [Porphyridium purpureum]|uniref:Sodium/proton antiporter 1 n=1 Tax=Porphyridium purpureum TaxID=35688 RepID=A0A5J4YX94_PORPP|nr:Sodium/proton antiporter 1 [Porphyridium purpureum]|eukprot:POR9761..scf209_3